MSEKIPSKTITRIIRHTQYKRKYLQCHLSLHTVSNSLSLSPLFSHFYISPPKCLLSESSECCVEWWREEKYLYINVKIASEFRERERKR